MGATFSSLFCRLFEKKQFRIGMCGLDNAGKTTILYKLKFGEVVKLIPTIGFNNETIEYRNVSFHIWDVGGNDRGRRWWSRQIFSDMKALICVIDSNDRERVDQVPMELGEILEANEFSDSVVLVLANKQDLPNAMSTDELAEQLGKVSQLRNRKWHIQSTCGITGEGLYEGLDWLVNEVSKLP